jgi:ribosomal protein S18 acetylase RimI-like enzyme
MTLWPVQSPAQWAQLAQLLQAYAAKDLDQAHLSTIWQDLQDLPARYGGPQGGAVLMTNETGAIACGAFTHTRLTGTCEIKRIYVLPAHRHQGHAKNIIRELLQAATQAGYTHVALSTWRNNTAGLTLYTSLGFIPVAPFKDHPNPDLLFLGLALTSPSSR